MQKILELNSQQWLSGITENINDSESAILSPNTNGVSAIDFSSQLEVNGILGVGCRPYEEVDSDGNSFTKSMTASASFVSTDSPQPEYEQYLYDTGGNIYQIDLPDPELSIFDVRTGDPLSDAAAGIETLLMQNGDLYLLYARDGHIGRAKVGESGFMYTSSNITFDDTWQSLSSTTVQRPMFQFQDRVYFGNENKVGMIFEEGGTMKINTSALDLPATDRIIDFSSEGKYLVIATDAGEIYFWNTNTDSWQRRHLIQRVFQGVYSIFNISGEIVVLLSNGIWRLGFSSPPERMFKFDLNSKLRPRHDGNDYVTAYGQSYASQISDNIMWVTSVGTNQIGDNQEDGIAVYSHSEGTVNSVHAGVPFIGEHSTSLTLTSTDEIIVVGLPQGEGIYFIAHNRYDPSPNTGTASWEDARQAQSGVTQAETRIIDMEDTYQVNMIEILLDQEPQTHSDYADDNLVVKARGVANDSYTTYGTIDTNSNGKEIQLRATQPITDDTIQIKLEFEGGNPLVRSVGVYGDKVSR